MSKDEDKIKHSKRLLKDNNAIAKQVKIAKEHGIPVTDEHRFNKHHAMDCGNPQCLLCSSAKILGEPTIKQKRFDQNIEEPRDRRSNGLTNQEDLS